MKELLNPYISSFLHSRVHHIKYIQPKNGKAFVKRDDELSFSISGSKLRKYQALLPAILKKNIKNAVMIGGAYSNNLLGLTQLFIENDIIPHVMIRGESTSNPVGNLLLLSALILPQQIQWISRKDWHQVEKIAKEYSQSFSQTPVIIPEGADTLESLPGALTLAFDIIENEEQLNVSFDHIFIEAGTGLTAIGLILGLAWLNKLTNIHIILLADTKEIFLKKLAHYHKEFSKLFQTNIQLKAINRFINFYNPPLAQSFGSTNVSIFKCIIDIARSDGFFTDPIYSAKLFYTAKHITENKNLQGNILLIHSGGGLALMGYQERLLKAIAKYQN